ncbi:class I SAM-dependent methyltransferase [Kovacikia minuta CCNUW1]|uniref:SAM-dependent methyltransferase n=1 Tax=Kovacikia minuta TaxID=2931930 RepID=UPI001CCFC4E1|nr:methyltransferase domain-containing protein [Kovacikia minuta]UBF23564.1 class I SAM-dependent methyltransferase [Kovacikia minuta CCNUW1]
MRFKPVPLLVAGVGVCSWGMTTVLPIESGGVLQTVAPIVRYTQQFAQVPYEPTPYPVAEAMLELAKVTQDDVVYDLGSGDGRIIITAAQKFGARGVGIDINSQLVEESRENARKAGVSDRVQFLKQDLFKADVRQATVVTLYLLPKINLKLRPILLRQLKPGTRIVSHEHSMGDWKPDQIVKIDAPDRLHTLYYWVVPKEIPEYLK